MDYYTFAEIDSEIKTDELTIIITIECPVLTSVARVLHRKSNVNRASKPCSTLLASKFSPSITRYQLSAFGARLA